MITDFHSHMLPAMDDGSPDIKTTIAMLKESKSQGVDNVILTPHYYQSRESIESFVERRRKSVDLLRKNWVRGLPKAFVGAEVYYFPEMSKYDLRPLCIYGSNVILVELPFEPWTGDEINEISALALDKKYHVILAHVERYAGNPRHMEVLKKIAELPVTMQLNAEGFTKLVPSSLSKELLKNHMAKIIGSDSHNLTKRPPNILKGRKMIKKLFGEGMLNSIDEVGDSIIREIEAKK